MGEIGVDKSSQVGLNPVRQTWGFFLPCNVRHRNQMDTDTVSHWGVRNNTLRVGLAGTKRAWEVLKEEMGMENSLDADFRALH